MQKYTTKTGRVFWTKAVKDLVPGDTVKYAGMGRTRTVRKVSGNGPVRIEFMDGHVDHSDPENTFKLA